LLGTDSLDGADSEWTAASGVSRVSSSTAAMSVVHIEVSIASGGET